MTKISPRQVRSGKVDHLIAAPVHHRLHQPQTEAAHLRHLCLGWHDKFLPRGHHVGQRRTRMGEGPLQRRPEIGAIFHPDRLDTHRPNHGGEIGILQFNTRFQEAGGFHLHLHETECTAVEDESPGLPYPNVRPSNRFRRS